MGRSGWVLATALLAGCCTKIAVNYVGDALAESGGVFATDEDLELVRDSVPFGLKIYESLLVHSPEHRGLLLSAASGFTQYAYAFVQEEADRLEAVDLARSREVRARAKKLYLRGRDYALRGLGSEPVAKTTKDDIPFLYWAGVAWAGAAAAAKDDMKLVADLPAAASMVARALELDESFNRGAAHEFFITYEGSRSEAMGGSAKKARDHYRRALELSKGTRASVHLALAESVAVKEQNVAEFKKLIAAASAVDPNATPEQRLANTLARRRAAWLESRIPELFLIDEEKK